MKNHMMMEKEFLDMSVNIQFMNETTEDVSVYEALMSSVIEETIKQESLLKEMLACSFIFVTNDRIQEINKIYRHKDAVTDVITFALEDEVDGDVGSLFQIGPRLLGDVFISLERTQEQAKRYQHSFERELSFLTVHGFLHLLGYDHVVQEEEVIMFKKQEEVLNALGIRR